MGLRAIKPSTPREWRLSIPYFDGRCEAVLDERTRSFGRIATSPDPERCSLRATVERDGYAVCVVHRRSSFVYAIATAARELRGTPTNTLVDAAAARDKKPWERIDWDDPEWK